MKPFAIVSSSIFVLVAVVHLLRLVLGWAVVVDGIQIPMWVSVVGLVVPAGLAYMLWHESRG